MRRSPLRIAALAFGLSLSALAGSVLSAQATAVTTSECEFNICGVESGNCFHTDVSWQCKETSGGCEGTYCNVS